MDTSSTHNMQSLIAHPRFINLRRVIETSTLPFFRSGELTLITQEDACFLRQELNILTYFDLRTQKEIDTYGKPSTLEREGISWVHLPMDQITDHFLKLKFQPRLIMDNSMFACFLMLFIV